MAESEAPRVGDPGVATPGGHPIEIWISYVLRAGTTISGAIIIIGVVLYLVRGPQPGDPRTLDDLIGGGGHSVATSWRSVLDGVLHARPLDVIRLGLLVLILTPLMRVALTFVLFLAQRDRVFIAVTAVVLVILVLGFLGFGV